MESKDKRFYGQVPNIIWDSDLSIYARTLYTYLIRFYGENKGKHVFRQSLSYIAVMTDMSRTKVIDAKKELQQCFIPLIKVVEVKDVVKGGVNHEIYLTDEVWDLQEKHYVALNNKNKGLQYVESDIVQFEKSNQLLLAQGKERESKNRLSNHNKHSKGQSKNGLAIDEFTRKSEGVGSPNMDVKNNNINNSIKDFSSPKQSFDLFTVETQPLLKKYMSLFGITEQMIPTAKNKGNLGRWKNALNKMLKIAEGDSKLAEKMMLRTFNSWSNKNPQFRKDCTSPFNLVNSFKEQYAEFVREQNESAKEKELLSKNTEYISGSEGAKMLKDIQKKLRK